MIRRQNRRKQQNIFSVRSLILTLLLIGSFFVGDFSSIFAQSAFNQQINYQGKLTDNNNVTVADGNYNMEFKLYTVASGGSPIWTETRTGSDKVSVKSGLFSVMLGSVTSLAGINFNQTLYLGVNIGGSGSCGGGFACGDGEMTPRKILGAVPAAIEAYNLGGASSTQYLRSDQVDTLGVNSAQTALAITQSGAGNIFTAGTSTATFFSILNNGLVGVGTTTPTTNFSVTGNGLFTGLTTVSGAGTSSFTNNLSIGGALSLVGALFDSTGSAGTNGKILQTTGSATQWVATSTLFGGNPFLQGGNSFGALAVLGTLDNNALSFKTNNNEVARFDTSGKFGIGTTSPSQKLDIWGNLNVATGSIPALFVNTATGNVGVGNSSPAAILQVTGALDGSGTNNNVLKVTTTGSGATTLLSVGENSQIPSVQLSNGSVKTSNQTGSTLDITVSGGTLRGVNGAATQLQPINIGGNTLTFKTGTSSGTTLTSALFIDSSQNVGIGTSSPSQLLDLWGNLNVATSSTPLLFANTATGNIGIGTSTPTFNLDIVGNWSSQLVLGKKNQGGRIDFRRGSDGGTAASIGYDNATDGGKLDIIGGGGSGKVLIHASGQDVTIDSGNAFNTIFSSTQQVGIGTTTPSQRLDVWGNLNIATSSTPALFVNTANTLVGIGTSSPTTNLSVNGGGLFTSAVTAPSFFVTGATGISTGNNSSLGFNVSGTSKAGLLNDFELLNTIGLVWRASIGSGITDIGLRRNGPGILEVNSGTASDWRDLIVRNLSLGTTSTSSTLTIQGVAGKDALEVASSTGTSLFHVAQNGFAGIGSTTPTTNLSVAGNGLFTGLATVSGAGTSTFSNNLSIGGALSLVGALFDSTGSAGTNGKILQTTGSATQWVATSTLFGGNPFLQGGNSFGALAVLGTLDNNALSFKTNNNEVARFDTSGNFGIGTTSPSARLALTNAAGTGDLLRLASSTNTSLLSVDYAGNISTLGTSLQFNTNQANNWIGGINQNTASVTLDGGGNPNAQAGGRVQVYGQSASSNAGKVRIFSNNNAPVEIGHSGSVYLTLNSSGNLGLGTTSPSQKLDIWGNLNVATGTNPALFVDTTTNRVGIGTSTPATSFHLVNPNNTGSSPIAIFQSTGTQAPSIKIQGTDRSVTLSAQVNTLDVNGAYRTSLNGSGSTNNAYLLVNGNAATTYGSLGADSVGNLVLNQASSTLNILLSGGNVGIGTTTPTTKFSVAGNALIDGVVTASSFVATSTAVSTFAGGISIPATKTINLSNDLGETNTLTRNNSLFQINSNTVPLVFNVGSSLPERLRITTAGNVGIGTSSPSQLLDIWGNLNVATSSTPALFVNTANTRVGIGTSTPTTDFSVAGNGLFTGLTTVSGAGTSTFSNNLSVGGALSLTGALFDSTGSAGTNGKILQTTGSATQWVATSTLFGGNPFLQGGNSFGALAVLGTLDNNALSFKTNNNEVARFDTSGNFGIGTTSPQQTFDVSGNAQIWNQHTTGASSTDLIIRAGTGQSNGAGGNTSKRYLEFQNNAGTPFLSVWNNSNPVIYADQDNQLEIQDGGGVAIKQRVAGGNTNYEILDSSGISLANNELYKFSSSNSANGSADLGLYRNGVGVLEINSGTAGTFRDLIVRNLSLGTTSQATTLTLQGVAGKDLIDFASSTGSSLFHIAQNGFVGVGSSTPTTNLSVAGNELLTGVTTVSGAGTSTFSNNLSIGGALSLTGSLFDSTVSRGQSGYVLKSTGSGTQWVATSTLGISASAAGSNGQVQFNNGGALGASSNFTWDNSNSILTVDTDGLIVDPTNLNYRLGSNILDKTNGYLSIQPTGSNCQTVPLFDPCSETILQSQLINLGDVDGNFNSTYLSIDNKNQSFTFNSGDVYIPSNNLHLTGALYDSGNNTGTDGYVLKSTGSGINWVATSTLFGGTPFLQGGNSFGALAVLGTLDNNALSFKTNNNEVARFDTSGNFGIGTTSPSQKLDVWGNLNVATSSTSLFIANTATQKVGVGTSTPTTNFSVAGNGLFTGLTTVSGAGTSSFTNNLSVGGALSLTGALFDSVVSPGQSGYILKSTASGVQWVATSSLITSGVSSVSNSDGTLTISPTNGAVIASLNLGNPNIWTGGQTFGNASSTNFFAANATATNARITNAVLTNATTTIANIPALSNLTTNGFIKTSGGLGTLTVDTTSYIPVGQANAAWTIGNGLIYNATSTDRVGIGTSTPNQILTLASNSTSGTNNWIYNTSSSGFSSLATLNDGATNYNQFITFGTGYGGNRFTTLTAAGLNEFSSHGSLVIGTDNSSPLYFGTNNAVRGVIDSSGNFGIGTTSPGYKLDVAGSITSRPITNTSDYIRIGDTGGANGALSIYSQDLTVDGGAGSWFIGYDSTNASDKKFRITAFGARPIVFEPGNTEAMRITSSGLVGIGTSSPSQKLDVWGNLNIATSSTPTLFANTATGNVGIGTNNPGSALDIVTNSTAITFGKITNSNSSGAASFGVYNNSNHGGFFRSYGTGFSVASLADTASFGADSAAGIVVFGNASAASGGSGYISLRGGGYDSAAENLRLNKDASYFSNVNVGVGSSSPIATLSVKGSGGTNPFVVASSTDAQLLSILPNGFVGIGSSTPTTNFSVAGNGLFTGLTTVSGAGTSTFSNNLSVGGSLSLTASLFDSVGSAGANGAVLKSTGSATTWVATSSLGLLNSLNGLTASTQTFATTTTGNDFSIVSSGSTHTFNWPSASASSRGLLTSTDWSTFNGKQNAITPGTGLSFAGNTLNSVWTQTGNDIANNNSGNVGVGSSTPFATLAVKGIAGATNPFVVASSSDAQLLTILPNGFVGVGSSTPTTLLSVAGPLTVIGSGTSTITTNVIIGGITVGSNSFAAFNVNNNSLAGGQMTTTGSGVALLGAKGNGSFAFGKIIAQGGDNIQLLSSGNGSIALGSANRKNITSSGSGSFAAGFATTGDITATGNNSLAFGDNINSTAAGAIAFGSAFTNSTSSSFAVGFSALPTLFVNSTSIGVGSTSPIATLSVKGSGITNPFVVSSSTDSQLFTILPSGFVGVGSSTPTTNFSVNGSSIFLGDGSKDILTISTSTSFAKAYFDKYANLTLPSGSISNPALQFPSATPPGIFSSSGSLDFEVGGNERLTILGLNGNVGVSSSTPAARLAVKGAGASTGFTFQTTDSSDNPKFVILDNGKVGIGSTTPTTLLSVSGDGLFIGLTTVSGAGTSTFSNNLSIGGALKLTGAFFDTNTSAGANGSILQTNGSATTWVATSTLGLQATITAGNGLTFSGNTLNSVWTTSGSNISNNNAGNVGIGSSTPVATLSVKGTGNTDIFTVSSSSDTRILTVSTNGNVGIGTTTPGSNFVIQGTSGSTDQLFEVASSSGAAILHVTSSGNVGVGTSSPIASLSVVGQGAINPFIVASSTQAVLMTILPNGNVGIGTSTPAEALQVQGNVLVGAAPNSSQDWTAKNASTGQYQTTTTISTTTAAAVYNGSLYVGVANKVAGKAEIYRYNGDSTWTIVSSSTASGVIGSAASGNTSAIDSVPTMAVYQGYLYVGTSKSASAEVYRYNGGNNWQIMNVAAGKFGSTASIDSVSAMAVVNGYMYIGTSKSAAAEVYRYEAGATSTTWTSLNATAGTFAGAASKNAVTSMISYQNHLYIGTGGVGTVVAQVFRYDGGTTSATAWTALNAAGTFGGGTTAIEGVTAMQVWDGGLYVGTSKSAAAEVYRYDSSYASTTGASFQSWTKISSTTAGTIASSTGSTGSIDKVLSMAVYNSNLYIGTRKIGGAEIYSLNNAGGWSKVSSSTAGAIPAVAGGSPTTAIDEINALQNYNGKLYAMTGKVGSTETYEYSNVIDQSYALKFNAQSTTATNSQKNGLLNTGTITFFADDNTNNNIGTQSTGRFYFSNGINTSFGAYDVAEDYPTRDDTLSQGDLVSIDTSEKLFVKKSTGMYDNNIVGVYSSNPAMRLSQVDTTIDGARAVPVALAGRVPVKVSLENGPIEIGDYLTVSSVPGTAAKAVKPGRVIGRALSFYHGAAGEDPKVTVFLGFGSITAQDLVKYQPIDINASSSGAGLLGDATSTTASSTGLVETDSGLALLTTFLNQPVSTSTAPASMISVDRVAAGLDVITPRVLTKGLVVDHLDALDKEIAFNNDVIFFGRPYFNSDTAGFALIKAGDKSVDVAFDSPYFDQPIVNASVSFEEASTSNSTSTISEDAFFKDNVQYVITRKSEIGFTILLSKPAKQDIKFSWIALAVKSAKTFASKPDSTDQSNPTDASQVANVISATEGQASSTSATSTDSSGGVQPDSTPLATTTLNVEPLPPTPEPPTPVPPTTDPGTSGDSTPPPTSVPPDSIAPVPDSTTGSQSTVDAAAATPTPTADSSGAAASPVDTSTTSTDSGTAAPSTDTTTATP